MNAIVTTEGSSVATLDENALINVLQSSLYPGAKPDSIKLVLAWCRATGRDPMKKPIHIVPMSVKIAGTNRYEYRDTLMPGIGTYRTDAATTGQYAGKTEPEFGPDVTREFSGDNGSTVKVTYPQWCRVTVKRSLKDKLCEFTAKEFWVENYATAGRDSEAPNTMWRKRPYGQLAKCAESQALRMAFPDETGNTNTAEEMEGKQFAGPTIEHADEPTPTPTPREQRIAKLAPTYDPPPESTPQKRTVGLMLEALAVDLAAAQTPDDYDAIVARDETQKLMDFVQNGARQRLTDMLAAARTRTQVPAVDLVEELADSEWPGPVPA